MEFSSPMSNLINLAFGKEASAEVCQNKRLFD